MTDKTVIRKILFAIGVFITLIVLIIIFLLISTLKKTPPAPLQEKPITQKDATTPLVLSVQPLFTQSLETDKIQKFVVTLDPSVVVSEIRPSVSSSPPADTSKKTAVPTTTTIHGYQMEIVTSTALTPVTTYTLTLLYRSHIILQQAYISTASKPTPAPTNNITLSTVLPYETLNYILKYNKEQNAYIVHFKYDPSSKTDLSTQFNEAKEKANNFIRSKGIDPNKIIIAYSYK